MDDIPISASKPEPGDDIPIGKATRGMPSWTDYMKQMEQVDNVILKF